MVILSFGYILISKIGMTMGMNTVTRLSTAATVHVAQPRLDAPATAFRSRSE